LFGLAKTHESWSIRYDWSTYFPFGGVEEEFGFKIKPVTMPKRVWTEAMTSFAISIYREEAA
jgi:hypothetical protein